MTLRMIHVSEDGAKPLVEMEAPANLGAVISAFQTAVSLSQMRVMIGAGGDTVLLTCGPKLLASGTVHSVEVQSVFESAAKAAQNSLASEAEK